MASSMRLGRRDEPRDFTDLLRRIRPALDSADPGMVVQPPVDPGYMPNIDPHDVVQRPEVEGWLPASGLLSQAVQDDAAQPTLAEAIEILRRYGVR